MYVNIQVDTKSASKMLNVAKRDLAPRLQTAVHNFAIIVKDSIKRQLLIQQKFEDRTKLAQGIRTKKESNERWTVVIPLKAHWLDSMRPHYVSLRRGRMINRWTARNYGLLVKRGLSRVYQGPQGGIRGGYLYVTPDPFVSKGFNRVAGRLQTELKRAVKNTFKSIGG